MLAARSSTRRTRSRSPSSASTSSTTTPTSRSTSRSTTPASRCTSRVVVRKVEAEDIEREGAERDPRRRRRHPGAGRLRLPRHRRQDRGDPLRAGRQACRSSASAWACSAPSSSSPATWSAWRTPTATEIDRQLRPPRRLPARRPVRRSREHGRHDAAGLVPVPAGRGQPGAARPTAARLIQERHRHRYEFNNQYRAAVRGERHGRFRAPARTASWSR